MVAQDIADLELLPIDGDIEVYNPNLRVDYAYTVPSYRVTQSTSYYCGPASVLQALKSAGVSGGVSGSSDDDKQKTLASNSNLGTDRDGATWIELMPAVMDNYTGRTRKWTTGKVDATNSSTKNSLTYFARSNHAYGQAVIYLVRTESLSYYNGKRVDHYITGTAIYHKTNSSTDYANISVRLVDPNNNPEYNITTTEPFENLREIKVYVKI